MAYIKTYMVIAVLLGMVLIRFTKLYKPITFESIWLALLAYLLITSLFAADFSLMIKGILGQLILVAFFFFYKFIIRGAAIVKYNSLLIDFGKLYLTVSLMFYCLGLYVYFVKGIDYMPMFYPEQQNRVLGGIFNRWTSMPRMAGLRPGTDSFNWMCSFFIIIFLKNNKYKWALLGLVCGLLTFSITFVLVLCVVLIFVIVKKGKIIQVASISAIFAGIGLYFYKTNVWFSYIIETRINNVSTGTGRFHIWSYVLDIGLDKPIFGHGINQLKAHLLTYPDPTIRSAHNTLLEIFFNGGLVGVSIYVLFLLSFFLCSYNLDKKLGHDYFKAIFLCYFIYSMANTSIYEFSTLLFFSHIYIYAQHYFGINKNACPIRENHKKGN